jgi:ketosteroid isomerase-like protein
MARWLWTTGVAAAVAVLGAQGATSALESLVQAERAFALTSVQTSQRDAFLSNFADDGVWFSPGPENTKEALRKQPAPSGPPTRTLDWEPATGDVAASGDLGYTTGPYVSTAKAPGTPPRTGWFFSVWRWRGDVQWKVAADFGIECPTSGPLRPRTFKRASVRAVVPRIRPDATALADELRDAETAFVVDVGARGLADAYRERATADVLMYRQGRAPIAGKAAVLSYLGSGSRRVTWEPAHAETSQAGDLGFTYGVYTEAADGGGSKRGYYLHVWKRLADGWALAVDVTNQ